MKKIFIILCLLLAFCASANADTYINEKYKMDRKIQQSINKNLQNNPTLSGKVEVYFNIKPNITLNKHKIINYNNRELAELIDNTLNNLEECPINSNISSFNYIAIFNVQNGKLKTEIVSKNYSTPADNNYFSKIQSHIQKNKSSIPQENYIDLNYVVLELNISSIGKVTGIRLIESSGDKNYDDKLCNYFLAQTFDLPPSELLKNGNYRHILRINPTSKETAKEHEKYTKLVLEEVKQQIGLYINNMIEIELYKNGHIKDVKIYDNNYNLINSPQILSELKKVKITQYPEQLKGETFTVYLINNNSYTNVYNYFNKKMAPEIVNSIPLINSFSLQPIKCIILMNKNGTIEDVTLIQSSNSLQIDNDTIAAIKYNSYQPYDASPTEKFIFYVELYNLNKYLRQYYAKYAKTVTSYTIGNMPKYGAQNIRTSRIHFHIKKDGKIKSYELYDYNGFTIKEDDVDKCIRRLTFPKFPENIDAEELSVLVDLHDPSNQMFSNILMNTLSIGSAIMYIILR